MFYKTLLIFLLFFSSIKSALSQAVPSNNLADGSSQTNDTGNVSGFYYSPTTEASPSLSQMDAALDSGYIQFDSSSIDLDYNPQRVWQKGATPDFMSKIGDFTNNPELDAFFNFKSLSFKRILGNENTDSTPLKSIGIINSMTLEELVEIFPELQNQAVLDIPIIRESLNNTNANFISDLSLSDLQKALLIQLSKNPVYENIPLASITAGDWNNVISQTDQQLLQQLLSDYPELELVTLDQLFPTVSGTITADWRSVLTQAKNVVLAQGSQISLNQLLSLVPELQNIPLGVLPIDNLVLSDIEGLENITLSQVPDIDNSYLFQVGNLSQLPASYLLDYEPGIFTGDLFGKLDIAYAGETENPITHVLSGGTRNQKFKPEPCYEKSCKHFEITDVFNPAGIQGNLSGKAWVQGTSQSVPGGKGFLIAVNGGKERTGVSVWSPSSHVKLSLENIDEGGNGVPASAQVWFNFQFCITVPFLGEQCTPHFIPIPTPWKVQEGGLMLVFSRDRPSELIRNATANDKQS